MKAIALAAGAVITATLAYPVAASAQWSTTGSGPAGAGATTMPAGATPTATARLDSVSVSWSAVTLASGAPVAGYIVHRYNTLNGSPATVGAGCAGIVTSTSCVESSVPSGTWMYTDTPVQANWSGPESSPSSSVATP